MSTKSILVALVAMMFISGVAYTYSATTQAAQEPEISVGPVSIRSTDDTDMVVKVTTPDSLEPVGEIRWDTVEYTFSVKNIGNTDIRGIDISLIPTSNMKELYGGLDPFNELNTGRSINYGRAPDEFVLRRGEVIEVTRTIVTHAHETEFATDVESPLSEDETEQFESMAADVSVRIAWGDQEMTTEATMANELGR